MARNDVYLNINALSPADAVVTGQQDMTAATVPELVLGDTPTFNFYFTDNTNVWPSWAGNTSYSLTWALSDAVAGDFSPAATTGNATPITGGWSVVLPLNSYDLVGLLNTKRVGQPYPVTNLWQQLRVTDPSGNEITRAMFWTPVRYRAISDTQNTESASPTGGRFVTVNNVNTLTTPTAAQFYAANPVPTSALGIAANGELLIGNGTGFTKSTLTAGTGITVTNGSGSITIGASGSQEILTATVKNAESFAITKGQVVYLFSATGGFASVKLAYNTSDATSAKTFGVVSSTSIAANGTGTVTCVGVVDGLNLGAYNDGDTLYLGATPGSVTATKPYAPNHLVYVGIVERANNGNGELYVKIQNGYELDEIHDVQINAPKLAGQTLIYDQTNDLWKNARLTGTANQITVTNADAAVTLSIPTNPTLPGNLTVSGTGTSTFGGNLTVSGGTITSGSGTLTLKSSANTVVLQSANITALTLDAYQNATIAGNLIVNGTGSGGNTFAGSIATTGANLLFQASTSIIDHSTGLFRAIGYGPNTSTAAGFSFIGLSSNGTVGGTRFSIDSSGNPIFGADQASGGTGNIRAYFGGTTALSNGLEINTANSGNVTLTFRSYVYGYSSNPRFVAYRGGGTYGLTLDGGDNTATSFAVYGKQIIGNTYSQNNSSTTDLTINPATKTSGNLLDAQVGGASKFAVDFAGNLTVNGGTISSGTASLTLKSTASTVVIQSAGTTGLTLDSSQRCILAGALRLNNAYTASAVVPTGYVTIQDSTGTTYKVCVLL